MKYAQKATAIFSIFLLFLTACGGGNSIDNSSNINDNTKTVSISITQTLSMLVGETKTLSVSAQNTDFTVSVSPASGSGCAKSVNNAVTCTPTLAGNYTVTVTATADTSKKATATVTVTENLNANLSIANEIDSDGDGLSDSDEINIYGTDPFLADTDGDGVDDGWEIFYGTNPLVADNNFPQTKNTGMPNEVNTVTASVAITLQADQVGTLEITPVTVEDNRLLSPSIPGYLGLAYDFSVSGSFDSAQISLHHHESLGTVGPYFQPRIYYFDETSGILTELPGQSVYSGLPDQVFVSGLSDQSVAHVGTVTATVTHFSTYILLNKVQFDAVWHYDIRKPQTGDGGTVTYKDIDVVFVIDESNSMENMENQKSGGENSDPYRIRVDAAKRFVDALEAEDRAGIIGFANDPRTILNLTPDKDVVKTYLDTVVGNRDSTQLFKGIDAGMEELRINGRPNADKLIIALTDGEDAPDAPAGVYEEVIYDAITQGITIYTVGLGDSVNAILLNYIAESTGGKYFYASTADALYDGFELIKDEAIDYRTDSNGDGIPDYYAKLIFEGKLRLTNGSNEMFMIGADIYCNPDIDGDGLLNGEELVIIEVGDRVMLRMISDPYLKDSDFDGFPDKVDKHPLQKDSFSDDVSDFMKLTEDGRYQYSIEADDYDNDFWMRVGDTVVAALSFTDRQQAYTMEMVEFFSKNASQNHIDNAAMAELERAIQNATYDAIGKILLYVDVVDSSEMNDIELETRIKIDAGRLITLKKEELSEAMAKRSSEAYQSWLAKYASEYLSGITLENGGTIDLPPFTMDKKGIPDNLIKGVKLLGSLADGYELARHFAPGGPSLQGVGYVAIAFDIVELGSDINLIWNAAKYIALDNANEGVFFQNYDLFCELRDNGKHNFTRSAAKFVVDSMTMNYLEASKGQNLRHALFEGAGIYVSVVMTFINLAHPVGWCIIAAKAVFDFCDVIFGLSDTVEGRARIICLSDMTEATVKFVNKFYLTDSWEKFGLNLENLINLRITGEIKFMDVFPNRLAEHAIAQNNITTVKQIAGKMNLYAVD